MSVIWTCRVVLNIRQRTDLEGFRVPPVKKLPDSKASDPLTSPANTQFYPPFKHIQSHQTQSTPTIHTIALPDHLIISLHNIQTIVFFLFFVWGRGADKQVISHRRNTHIFRDTQIEPCRSWDAPLADGKRTPKQRQMVLSSSVLSSLFPCFQKYYFAFWTLVNQVKDSRSAAMLIIRSWLFFKICL